MIQSIVTSISYRIQGHNLPKSGRPKVYTHRDYRKLLWYVRLYPKDRYEQVRTATGCAFKNDTVRKHLALYGIANWHTKYRPHLTKAYTAARLAWYLRYRYMIYEEWGLFIWSDECSVERGRGKNQEWCFCIPDQKWEREMIQTYNAYKNMSIMVWGCFWDHGRSDLYVMDRDFESKKYGYSARSYLQVLDVQVAP
jgi:hypothetical protein